MMATIRLATTEDLSLIHRLAHDIWWPTYRTILSAAQIEHMLQDFYSEDALAQQLANDYTYALWEKNGNVQGFACFRADLSKYVRAKDGGEMQVMRIERLYVLPATQGKGIGTQLIDFMAEAARAISVSLLELNVNRENPAVQFYLKNGFQNVLSVDIPYRTYVLNDYIMQKSV